MKFFSTGVRNLLWVTCAATAIAIPGWADTIVLPPVVNGTIVGIAQNVTAFGDYTAPGSTVAIGSDPRPFIDISAFPGGPNGESGATVAVGYYVVVTDDPLGLLVPFHATALLNTSAAGPKTSPVSAQAQLQLQFDGYTDIRGVFVSCGNEAYGADCSNAAWSGTLTANAGVGVDNLVSLFAEADVPAEGGTAHAYVDPFLQIDPAFHAAHPEIGFVLNVGNTPFASTPEPSTLWLAAFAPVAFFLIRRRYRNDSPAC